MAHIIWKRDANHEISHHRGVKRAVMNAARKRQRIAIQIRLANYYQGQMKINVRRPGDGPDAIIDLIDPNILSIEYGHRKKNGRRVRGMHIMKAISR